MNPSNPDPVNEWNYDSSWQDWPQGGYWRNPLDGQDGPPVTDPTAVSSAMTAGASLSPSIEEDSPMTTLTPPSLFDVGRSLSLMDPLKQGPG